MKARYILLALGIGLFVTSCQDEYSPNQEQSDFVKVSAGIPGTRVSFVGDETGGMTYATWTNGDVIELFTNTQNGLHYTASVVSDGQSYADFVASGDALQNNEGEVVYASYSATRTDNTSKRISIGQSTQWQTCIEPFLYAVDTIRQGNLNLRFKHVYSYLRLTLTQSMLPDEAVSSKVGKLLLSSDTALSVIEGSFDFSTETLIVSKGGGIEINTAGHDLMRSSLVYYIPIIPQSAESVIRMEVYSDLTSEEAFFTLEKQVPASGFLAGHVYTLTLEKPDISITSGDAIDLGLSVKWGSCNIGANNPEEFGGYYAWGETEEKEDYAHNNYFDGRFIRYFDSDECISGTDYDVAMMKKGRGWHLPTKEEYFELLANCTFEWGTYRGVTGQFVTGPNGNSVFFPACGFRSNTTLFGVGTRGHYWSGTMTGYNIYKLGSKDDEPTIWDISLFSGGYMGYSVRPVFSYMTVGPTIMEHLTSNAIRVTSFVSLNENINVSEKGFCYDFNTTPTISNQKVLSTNSGTEISSEITGLIPDSTYYIRAYAISNGVVIYGEEAKMSTAGIYSLKDLVAFRDARNADNEVRKWKNSFGVINIYADIDLSSIDNWTMIDLIGADSWLEVETLEGNGHTISGLKMCDTGIDGNSVGFIAKLNSSGIIRNLHLDAGEIEIANGQVSYCGAICADANGGTIVDCSSNVNITILKSNNALVAGISGFGGHIERCVNRGSIIGGFRISGICGQFNSSRILDCVNYGTLTSVEGTDMVSGITQNMYGNSSISVTNCVNHGTLHGEYADNVGGIEAFATYTRIENCVNYGDIIGGKNTVGGICGKSYSAVLTNNRNEGNVQGPESASVGGICGDPLIP